MESSAAIQDALSKQEEDIKSEDQSQDTSLKIETDLAFDDNSPLTPSPTSGKDINLSSAPGASRRPPRKSTLTQQQKNQKRQRATQDQLGTLEIEFNKNPTPTAAVRERIARDIDMTERSVQIWFQNRRAKIKNLAKKSIETGEDCDAIPDSMRRYLAMQAFESGKPMVHAMMRNGTYGPYGTGLIMNTDAAASKVLISHLQVRSLEIGTWRRVSQNTLDLVVFYSPEVSKITYYINAESSGFKIEFPFSHIKTIQMDHGDGSSAEGASPWSGGLVIELSQPPAFSMDHCQGGWYQCADFTENKQASQHLVHRLGGHPKILSGQLAKLMTLDSFRNRHRIPDPQMLQVPTPISPLGPMRPASQPNHLVHPHHQHNFQEAVSLMGPPPPRGHKRQRSRSVPAALDLSQIRQAPHQPGFFLQPPDSAPHFIHHHHHTFAPVPQRSFSQQYDTTSPLAGTPGLENSPAFNFDFQAQVPQSATTVDAAEFSPFRFGMNNEQYGAPTINQPFMNPFLSPMPDQTNMIQATSPHSTLSHQEPLIADHSPGFAGEMVRSASADVFTTYADGDEFGDQNFAFGEMQQKQPFILPFRAPELEVAGDDFDFQQMINMPGPDSESVSPPSQHYDADGQALIS